MQDVWLRTRARVSVSYAAGGSVCTRIECAVCLAHLLNSLLQEDWGSAQRGLGRHTGRHTSAAIGPGQPLSHLIK
jgi:hypothetical protein